MMTTRRKLIQSIGAAGVLGAFPMIARSAELLPKSGRRVVIVGGGFGGAMAAKQLRVSDPSIEVVLVERQTTYTGCPTSNLIIGGSRKIEENQYGYEGLKALGVKIVIGEATAIDPGAKAVVLAQGTLTYDKLIVSPGIDFRTEELDGYQSDTTPEKIPHAWKAGPQTSLLRKQIESMKDGGQVVISIPLPPFRGHPAPYERICQIAWYLKQAKPKSRILVLDANPSILAKGELFKAVWDKRYSSMIEYRPNHNVVKVLAETMTVEAGGNSFKGDVINVIPPQRAGNLLRQAKLTAADHWCPVSPVTLESTLAKDIFVLGDSAHAGAMPKSAFSANAQAKACVLNLLATLSGKKPTDPVLTSAYYSFVSDKEAISSTVVFRVVDGKLASVPGSVSHSTAPSEKEGTYGKSWFANILAETSR